MDGFRNVAMLVKDDCLGAYWWVWGRFVSNLAEPQFGDREALTCLAFLPLVDLDALPSHRAAEVLNVLQRADQENSVDAGWVIDFPSGHNGVADTMGSLESKWRPRAIRSPIEDDDNPVGYIEVRP